MIVAIGRHLNLTEAPIAFDEWLELVAKAEGSDDSYPVRQLFEFFEGSFRAVACGQIVLDTSLARSKSKTLSNLIAVDDELVRNYVRHWKAIGYLEK